MENQQYFVVLQNSDGVNPQGALYPEVHYVFSDDAFAPEMDAVERQPGDISVLVDLDETGTNIVGCQSISPEWQVTDASLVPQALDSSTGMQHADANHNSKLLRISGTPAKQNLSIPSLKGSFDAQVDTGLLLIEQLKSRYAELRSATASLPSLGNAESNE